MMKRLLCCIIDLYQATLSPDHGALRALHPYGFCRHEPTCSAFGKRMIEERGVIVGLTLLARRLLSCNPWTNVSEEKMRALSEKQLHGGGRNQ